MKVVIAEDDLSIRTFFTLFITKRPEFQLVGIVNNREELIESIIMKKPDLLLMDLDMQINNGIEAIEYCKDIHPLLQVIFITSKDYYAVRAFELGAVDYIVKPLNNARLFIALGRFLQICPPEAERKNKLILKQKSNLLIIPLEEVLFIQKLGAVTYLHTINKIFEWKETLMNIQCLLDSRFLLSHRSNIINMDKLIKIEKTSQIYYAHFLNYQKKAKVSKYKIEMIKKYLS
ncbi:MAG: LytTR family DNA-binding domain-containing protein [Bacillus sp. (in: firmicutes)]